MSNILNLAGASADGTTVGETTSQLVGMHGSATSQAANVVDVTTTATSITTAPTSTVPQYIFTSTQATAQMAAINSILACLEAKGLMASA